jgi:hypothetical protein
VTGGPEVVRQKKNGEDESQRRRTRAKGAVIGIAGFSLMTIGGEASSLGTVNDVVLVVIGIALLIGGIALQIRGGRT